MKNNRIGKALLTICAIVLLAGLLPIAHAEQYRVGDAEISATIRNLEINWTSGRVDIAYHSGNTILISEKTTGVISEDMRMRWRLDGDTLRIEYDKPGLHLFSFMPHEKELTVDLPDGLKLEKADISVTSGDVNIPALYADELKLGATSGDIRGLVHARTIKGKLTSGSMEVQVMNTAEEVSLESTSGSITLEAMEIEKKAVISTTSGSIRAAVKQTDEFKANSTSGAIKAVIGNAKNITIGSTSGKVIADISTVHALDIHTTSGGVTAYLPQTPGFTAQIETTSGRFESQLALTKQGNAYIAGDGSGTVKIHATSGNILLNARENK
ncbi:MAG: DUF4097 family beta strand repeat protein [Clostridia bacterium]|nr:DUF4097 family beta strand repeat protein [Clostridia bacterium]